MITEKSVMEGPAILQTLRFPLLDENGFSPSEAMELKRRIEDVRHGRVMRRELIEAE